MRELRWLQSHVLTVLAVTTVTVHASVALAQAADVGLSTVRAQRFDRSSLPDPNVDGEDSFGWAFAAGDFNGDGADDLATGAPASDGSSAAPVNSCGAVVVRYGVVGTGLAGGVAPTLLGQFVLGPFSYAEADARFGHALTACNLNADAYDDLVVGVPWKTVYADLTQYQDAGMIEVYYGTSAGLVPPASTIRREVANLNLPTSGALFGYALACGDFNLDGYDDLAVGLPTRDLSGGGNNAGRINVYSGSPSGLGDAAFAFDQETAGVGGYGQPGDLFGAALGVGDFNGDDHADLVVGIPAERFGVLDPQVGGVQVFYGAATGLVGAVNERFAQSHLGGIDEEGAAFGYALAVGNFDGDDYADVAIGAPYDDSGSVDSGSFLEVFGSSPGGLDPTGARYFDQLQIYAAPGESEPHDWFGKALAAADFNGDGTDDLAIGHPAEDLGPVNVGAVTIVLGSTAFGLQGEPHRPLTHGFEGVPGVPYEQSTFGDALASGDFDGDDFADLAIGASTEGEDGLYGVGTVTVLYGALFADGFEDAGMSYWSGVQP